MNWWGPWLFLVFLANTTYTIAAGICGYVLWGQRHYNGISVMIQRLSLTMWGLCLMGVFECFANACGYTIQPKYNLGYALNFWTGRFILCSTLWYFALYMLRGKKQ